VTINPAGPYTRQQIRLFKPIEPFVHWVEEALEIEGDHSLTAGVHHYMWQCKQIKSIEAQLTALLSEQGRLANDAQEVLKDLEYANAFTRVTDQIAWLKSRTLAPNSEAQDAYADLVHHNDIYCDTPDDLTIDIGDHKDKRCHRCGVRGHIRAKCPYRRKPRSKKSKNTKSWAD